MMGYDELSYHIGHKLELNEVYDWQSNLVIGLEIRCADCEGCEPILELDNPEVLRTRAGEYKLRRN